MRLTQITSYLITVDLLRANLRVSTHYSHASGSPPVDLLALNYSNKSDTYSAGGFTVNKVRNNGSDYSFRLNILNAENQLLGYILTNPTSSKPGRQNLRPFHADNEALYTLNYWALFLNFLHTFGLEIANFSQLDIALDTQQLDPDKLIQSYTSKPADYYRVRRYRDKGKETIGTMDEVTGKQQYTTYWGKGSCSKSLKIYNKTLELTKKPKSYITDWHIANGFDPAKSVYRVEVSIHSRAMRKYSFCHKNKAEDSNHHISDQAGPEVTRGTKNTKTTTYELEPARFNQPAYLATIFETFFPIDIRKRGCTRATNDIRVPLIDFKFYGSAELNTSVATRPTALSLNLEKKLVERLVVGYQNTNEDHYLASAWGVAAAPLADYLTKLLTRSIPTPPLVLPCLSQPVK